MPFQWLQMRIAEENDRREKETLTSGTPARCYGRSARCDLRLRGRILDGIRQGGRRPELLSAQDSPDGPRAEGREVGESARVEISTLTKPPGLHIDRNGDVLDIEVGVLPGDKIFYKDGDDFLTLEELTRRILDRSLFPKTWCGRVAFLVGCPVRASVQSTVKSRSERFGRSPCSSRRRSRGRCRGVVVPTSPGRSRRSRRLRTLARAFAVRS